MLFSFNVNGILMFKLGESFNLAPFGSVDYTETRHERPSEDKCLAIRKKIEVLNSVPRKIPGIIWAKAIEMNRDFIIVL